MLVLYAPKPPLSRVGLTYQWPQRFPGYWGQKWPAGWWKWAEWRQWRCDGASRRSCSETPSAGSLYVPGENCFLKRAIFTSFTLFYKQPMCELKVQKLYSQEKAQWAQWVWQQWAQPHARTKSKCHTGQCGCRCEAALPPLRLKEIKRKSWENTWQNIICVLINDYIICKILLLTGIYNHK